MRKIIQETVNDMLEKDITEPSKAAGTALVVLALKSGGTLHFCVDLRRLDSVAIKNLYP